MHGKCTQRPTATIARHPRPGPRAVEHALDDADDHVAVLRERRRPVVAFEGLSGEARYAFLMPLKFHPKPGQILMCDFRGLEEPEMVKRRPVVVLTGDIRGRDRLVTIVALGSTAPEPVRDYHLLLPDKTLPQIGMFQGKQTWLKGDMVYAMGWKRRTAGPARP
mgnify:CR=1 FL=1